MIASIFLTADILQPLVDIANSVLTFFHDDVGLTWGASIIALTFVTRAAILPLSVKQIRSMRAMSALQPQIKQIQERYKDDKQRLQREMMKIYQDNGVNPFSSCLPLLLQIPVFLTLLNLLRSSEFKAELVAGGADPGWFFINDLAAKATGSELAILMILYVGTSLAAGLVMSGGQPGQQRMIAIGLPLVFAPIIIGFPAGVVLYWISTNVWTLGQQIVIKQFFPQEDPVTPEMALAAKAPPPPPRKRKRRR